MRVYAHSTSRTESLLVSTFGRKRRSLMGVVLFLGCVSLLCAGQGQYTQRGDAKRQAQYSNEPFLNPSNVNVSLFGNLFSYNVDGYVAAQPLYVPNVTIPNVGPVNVVYVATQHDSIYAFNADAPGTGAPLWQVSFLNPTAGITSVPVSAQGCGVVNSYTEVGITGTPVIDPLTDTLYVVAKTQEGLTAPYNYVFKLHALDTATGAEKFGGPVTITASVRNDSNVQVTLSNISALQRTALLELAGSIMIGFGSNGCDKAAHGWLLAYNAITLQQQAVFNTSADDPWGSSLWMSGVGPASDPDGYIYLVTANGAFDVDSGGSDWGDSIMKLSASGPNFTVMDSFTPFNQGTMAQSDLDLGSGAAVILPDPSPGPYPELMVAAGKTGTIYLLNRQGMGGYAGPTGTDNVVEELPGAVGGVWGAPVFWNNTVYFAGRNDYVKAFPFVNGQLTTPPVMSNFAYTLTGIPSISANGTTNGVLWLVVNGAGNAPLLAAFNASTLQTSLAEIYNSSQNTSRDTLGATPHFATPLIANGKVYVGTQTQLKIYGLIPELQISSGNNLSQTVNQTITLTVKAVNPYTSAGVANVPVTFGTGGHGGTFNPKVATTNSSGVATTIFTMPTVAGSVMISATSPGYSTVNFTETAVAGPATAMVVSSGNSQTGTVGTTLALPLISKVKDSFGNGVIGALVTYSSGAAGGTFTPNPATTGSTGLASTTFTLPTTAKTGFAVTASSGSLTPATFHESATAGAATIMVSAGGNKQTGKRGTQLAKALIVTLKDQYGNGVPNVTVTFTDNGAGGTLSSPSAITNSAGSASTMYTLPPTPGTFTITASAGSLLFNFTEMGN